MMILNKLTGSLLAAAILGFAQSAHACTDTTALAKVTAMITSPPNHVVSDHQVIRCTLEIQPPQGGFERESPFHTGELGNPSYVYHRTTSVDCSTLGLQVGDLLIGNIDWYPGMITADGRRAYCHPSFKPTGIITPL